ncbi:tachylectin-related carbohydrate-binding protein [Nocardia sp. NPDC056000]|uniref:tachylectin-related carbohydrate-binding protein n=1 Tax=Nocardia sp. NPDC056000 TaxID=3345674 RepID=UPI0035DA3231
MSFRLICHGGSGLSAPFAGRIFGVEPDGHLRYYRYLGDGTADHSGSTGWDTHSGNTIGHGWTDFQHILGMGDGVLMGIQNNGDLRWYRYTGDGTQDPAGAVGADANNGNTIGNGWQNFLHVFVRAAFVRPLGFEPERVIYAVDHDGFLHWYRYLGTGEHDPSGAIGWHPNSGNIIGNGWFGFKFIVGIGPEIYGVRDDGALHWYRYTGNGENDPSGATGAHANNGNQIGRGWAGFRSLFAGPSSIAGADGIDVGYDTLWGVEENGDLRWYGYGGDGAQDPSGSTGWHPHSRNIIGNGW